MRPDCRLPDDADVTDRRFVLAALLAAVIAGCGGGSTGPGASPIPTATATPTVSATPLDTPAGTGGGGGSGGGGSGGGGSNTVVYQWQDQTDRSGNGVTDVLTSSYKAVVQVTLTKTDTYAYEISASADVRATFTEDYRSNCSHYTDDASGAATVTGQGGLQTGDVGEAYEFYIDLLGATGSNSTVRDDSPCGGPNNAETTEWPVPPVHVAGTDTVSDPHHVAGTALIPREGGTETVTWDFTLP